MAIRASAIGVPALAGGLVGGPIGAYIGAVGGQLAVDSAMGLLTHLNEDRRARAAVPILIASQRCDAPPEEMMETIAGDPRIAAVAFGASTAAADSTTVEKIWALGLLVSEAINAPTQIDEVELCLATLRNLGETHVSVLHWFAINTGPPHPQGRTLDEIKKSFDLGVGLIPVLQTLASEGLVAESVKEESQTPAFDLTHRLRQDLSRRTYGDIANGKLVSRWATSEFGRHLDKRLMAAGDAASEFAPGHANCGT